MKNEKQEWIGGTIGMIAYHDNMQSSRLVRVHYYKTVVGDICLVPVSGNNLSTIKSIKQQIITKEEFNNRDFDYYDDQVEYFWAIKKLGFELQETGV